MWRPRVSAAGPGEYRMLVEAFELACFYLATGKDPTGMAALFGRLVEVAGRGRELRCWWRTAGPDELVKAAISLAWVKASGCSIVRHLVLARPAGGSHQ